MRASSGSPLIPRPKYNAHTPPRPQTTHNHRMWKNQGGKSVGLLPGRESLGPLLLMATTPVFIFILWYTMYELDGDLGELVQNFKKVRALVCLVDWLSCWSINQPIGWSVGRGVGLSDCARLTGRFIPSFLESINPSIRRRAGRTWARSSPRPSTPRPGRSSSPIWPSSSPSCGTRKALAYDSLRGGVDAVGVEWVG